MKIKQNKRIKRTGKQISQFADDTTTFVNSMKSVFVLMEEIINVGTHAILEIYEFVFEFGN